MAKKRTINEYRQVKDSKYVAPVSHSEKETIKHKFTDSALASYIEQFLLDTILSNNDILPKTLREEIKNYVTR
tara:strand:+ start:4149 stop:4367 length:219 start_codon:yes stop_codon:yes gene_type:complete